MSSTEITVRWLGTNAWEITGNGATVLVDPWVTRFRTGAPKGEEWDMDTPLEIDEAAVDEHIGGADCVLVTHGHWDHITDVPYVAAKTGATVLGTETHLNLLRALDAPEAQLGQVSGGERYRFDGFTVEVFGAHHNPGGRHKRLLFAGSRVGGVPKRPKTVRDLVEGGSLAYQVTMGEATLFIGCTANFQERELEGIRPTVLFMQSGGAGERGARYAERLLNAAGHPPYVVPTHWDDYEEPLTEPAVDWLGAHALGEQVAEFSPESEYVLLDHLESFTFEG
ncbi:MBL fold metallo-hydrolase [Glycomyces arizonensis]|uniref:MBL fold metallo-hydrolase n=1 Tax=Glycomyces arizonensis TaxID=256035 RepID=UPI000418D0B3|nr:MBL fold metallo-hydrolase [Glycomyces arizonensis]